MDQLAIEIQDLHKAYGKKGVLNGLTLKVPKGSIYAYLGRNGEGKTTTMKLLLNILEPDKGSLAVLGDNVRKVPEKVKKRIGYIPETPFYYEWMKVKEVLDFIRSSYKETWDDKKAQDMITKLSIPLDSRISGMSLGMKAKVSLVAALAHNPEVLLLDDPTSGLDVVIRREFLENLVELVDTNSCTVLFSTHLITEVERIADRVGLLKNGKLEFEKSLEELKESTRKVCIRFPGEPPANITGDLKNNILESQMGNKEMTLILREMDSAGLEKLKARTDCKVDIIDMDLEEIFVAFTKDQQS